MVFMMPGEKELEAPPAAARTPREIVAELDKYVIGQRRAKKAVAIALRNRWRRQRLSPEMSREILPKNILMIGPTGVGKTEIARRLARLADAPFIKVEASKFTEVGYVGRDVESIVRDLTEVAVQMVREEKTFEIRDRARGRTEQRLLDLLLPALSESDAEETRNKLRTLLREGKLEDRMVEIEVADKTFPSFEIVTNQGVEEMDINVKEMLPGLFGGKKKRRKTTIGEARQILQAEEEGRLVDPGQVAREAVERAQSSGIVFLDEIDKVAGRESGRGGPDVSREGVQRDLLPIVEGTSVNTKYGFVKTDHVLFIAAGAFHVSKPADLIPELQGRFPIRVELDSLTEADFVRILTEPENALLKQYRALLGAENVDLTFSDEAIGEIARDAERVNRALENIGARRLHTILERLLEELSFAGPENAGKSIRIELADVQAALSDLVQDEDLSRYVL
ncbi:MAG TPA: ATP-dependent protease ATPase subunit HslU [Thermoanaerobaculia bacterium]|jgi:ATP-dependent HslUV protease ATP-binding subunit HslU